MMKYSAHEVDKNKREESECWKCIQDSLEYTYLMIWIFYMFRSNVKSTVWWTGLLLSILNNESLKWSFPSFKFIGILASIDKYRYILIYLDVENIDGFYRFMYLLCVLKMTMIAILSSKSPDGIIEIIYATVLVSNEDFIIRYALINVHKCSTLWCCTLANFFNTLFFHLFLLVKFNFVIILHAYCVLRVFITFFVTFLRGFLKSDKILSISEAIPLAYK